MKLGTAIVRNKRGRPGRQIARDHSCDTCGDWIVKDKDGEVYHAITVEGKILVSKVCLGKTKTLGISGIKRRNCECTNPQAKDISKLEVMDFSIPEQRTLEGHFWIKR